MGSPFNIQIYAHDSLQAEMLASNCFQLVDSLVNIYSDYIDSSELNRLCAQGGPGKKPFYASPALFEILWISKIAYEKSNGNFDITLGPVTRLWRKARKEKSWPTQESVAEKLALTGFDKVSLDSMSHTVTLQKTGMQLDLGGIAQGYIAQRVMDRIQSKGISTALVDVSGDIVAIGAPPGSKGWKIGVNIPEQTDELLPQYLLISNKAVTTSGDAYQFIFHDGKKYSHVIDPRTGYGITSQKNVTVIANDGTTADWLTKACSLLPVRKAKKLARQLQAEFIIATIKNGKLVLQKSKYFNTYWSNSQ
ncbi:FAD:protein FMN transferase [Flavihumibacter profundi]|uniref:FAD:protein FMN transferase n=1 Tax=Flavihumibacter profundi TaxID=2716883 RepID=UPI001CC738B4|nr:FAD:protein FMN transferase [Flavihumibacter profundi]MBZ5855971.1 FAD:protein FMN transferase [Flavihumibacter profundi]